MCVEHIFLFLCMFNIFCCTVYILDSVYWQLWKLSWAVPCHTNFKGLLLLLSHYLFNCWSTISFSLWYPLLRGNSITLSFSILPIQDKVLVVLNKQTNKQTCVLLLFPYWIWLLVTLCIIPAVSFHNNFLIVLLSFSSTLGCRSLFNLSPTNKSSPLAKAKCHCLWGLLELSPRQRSWAVEQKEVRSSSQRCRTWMYVERLGWELFCILLLPLFCVGYSATESQKWWSHLSRFTAWWFYPE